MQYLGLATLQKDEIIRQMQFREKLGEISEILKLKFN